MGKQLFGFGWFTSDAQIKEETDRFADKVYPLGKKQEEFEDKTIRELFTRNRFQSIKYICLIRKEMLIDNKYDEKEYNRSLKHMNINNEERKFIEYITDVELEAKTIEELPDIETIKKSYYEL